MLNLSQILSSKDSSFQHELLSTPYRNIGNKLEIEKSNLKNIENSLAHIINHNLQTYFQLKKKEIQQSELLEEAHSILNKKY